MGSLGNFLKLHCSSKPAVCPFSSLLAVVLLAAGVFKQNKYPAGNWKLDLVAHTCNPSNWESGDHEFEDRLGYIVKSCLKKNSSLAMDK